MLSVIQKFSGRGENVDDLFQVGCIGLIKAIDNFDTSQMVRFSTYGVPMIAGEIRRYLRDNSSIRVSRSMRDTAYKVLQAKERLTAQTQKEPSVEDLAKSLGIKREEVVFAMDAICDPVSLYEPIYSDGGESICVMDQVSDTKNIDENWLEQIALSEAISKLGKREKHILAMRFYDGKTQMEVAAEVGISQAQVSRLEKKRHQSDKKKYIRIIGTAVPSYAFMRGCCHMQCRTTNLRYKEVINICNGYRLGFVCDVEIDMVTGKVISLIVPGPCKIFGLFWHEDDYLIPWECITRVGEDIIFIEVPGDHKRCRHEKRSW